ncbi:MAG: hypothetical protein ACRDJW_09695 [Thermomicrobiales bacterium]
MAHAEIGDTVRVVMPKGLSKRGVHGISVMYTTWPEARFEGAVGHVTEVKPRGTHGVPLFLVDFRGHDNGRIALPWQSQWFREDWIALDPTAAKAQPAGASAGSTAESVPTASGVAAPDQPAPER